MFIWLLVALLVGGFAVVGHQVGAIRSGVAFLGVILGLTLNAALTPLVRSGLTAMGVKDEIALLMIPGVAIFVIFWLIFLGVGVAAHRPVELHFKYKNDEPTRKAFEKMNQGFGLFVGLLSGICVFFSVGSFVYKYGYATVQLESDSAEQAPIHYVSQIRQDMETTGWDKVFAAIDSTPASFYQISDIAGMLHATPLAHGRAATYPPFLRLSEKSEFTDVGGDKDYQDMLQQKASVGLIWNNPKTETILNNAEIMATLLGIDLQDFKTFLETGSSPKYQDDKILGHWRMDVGAVYNHYKRQKQTITPAEMRQFRAATGPMLSSVIFTAYADGRYKLQVTPPTAPPPPDPNAPAAAGGPPPGMDPVMAARYGLNRRGLPGARPAGAPPLAVAPPKPVKFDGLETHEGTWTRNNGIFILKPDGGKDGYEAAINETGRLQWVVGGGNQKLTVFLVRMT